jgi:hypothetical protein
MAAAETADARVQQLLLRMLTDQRLAEAFADGSIMQSPSTDASVRELLASIDRSGFEGFARSLHYKQLRVSAGLMPISLALLGETFDALTLGRALWTAASSAGSTVRPTYRLHLVDDVVELSRQARVDQRVQDAVTFEAACVRPVLVAADGPVDEPPGLRLASGVTIASVQTDIVSCWGKVRAAATPSAVLATLPISPTPTCLAIVPAHDHGVRVVKLTPALGRILGRSRLVSAEDANALGSLLPALCREGIVSGAP